MRWMVTRSLVVLTAALAAGLTAACASGSQDPDRGPETPTRIITGGATSADIMLADQRHAVGRDFTATARELFQATVGAYEELGIEVTELDQYRRVGSHGFKARRRLAGERLTNYLRCGVDVTGRPLADSGIATMDVVSEIVRLTDFDSRLETTVAASARRAGGTSTDPVLCTSRGGLEERIADLVAQRLP